MSPTASSSRAREVLAWGIFAVTCAAVATGGYLASLAGHGPTHLVDAALAVAFTGTGALVTIHRPGNALGPLGLLMSLAAIAFLADGYALRAGSVGARADAAAWLASWLWAPPMLALASVVLQLVPNGRVLSPRWNALLLATWTFIALFTVIVGLDLQAALPPAARVLVAVSGGAVVVASLASLVLRFRRARGVERRQLTWIVAGGVATIVAVTADAMLPDPSGNVVEAAGGVVLPLALGVAVLRHDLYAMDPVLRRSLTYTLLAGALAATTLLVSATVVAVVGRDRTTYALVLTVVAVVLLAAPVERVVRTAIGRMLYGDRGDPYAVLTDLGACLAAASDPAETMTVVAEAARRAVAAAYVELGLGDDTGRAVSVGTPGPVTLRLPITFNGAPQGVLGLSPRSAAEPFDALDRRVLDDLANYAGPAVAAALRTMELTRAREELVLAREEERRRLREDLHDGVGPVLAGLAFTADAAAAQVEPQQARLAAQLDSVREQARRAIGNVRRVTRGLRPESLDELGLRGALKEVASRHAGATVSVDLSGAEPWPSMSAASEVAVLHVVEEAVANAVRHGHAANITVEVASVADRLRVRVEDDGTGLPDQPRPGVGTASMRRRCEELGGRFSLRRAEVGTTMEMEVPLWQ